jgi:hypothetical protein
MVVKGSKVGFFKDFGCSPDRLDNRPANIARNARADRARRVRKHAASPG